MNAWQSDELRYFLDRIPTVKTVSSGYLEDSTWWIKLKIDVDDQLAWNVVQELGHILNSLSIESTLPTLFKPVSAPPYMNWGPKDYLYWVIESKDVKFNSKECLKWLEWRLPKPVDNRSSWKTD